MFESLVALWLNTESASAAVNPTIHHGACATTKGHYVANRHSWHLYLESQNQQKVRLRLRTLLELLDELNCFVV